MIISTLPDPERHPLWSGIRALLKLGGDRSGAVDWEPDHLVWIAIDGKQIIGAFSTKVFEGELVEVFNLGGHRVREWLPLAEEYVSCLARLAQAPRIKAQGRRGWARLNEQLGYRVTGREGKMTYYEKVL